MKDQREKCLETPVLECIEKVTGMRYRFEAYLGRPRVMVVTPRVLLDAAVEALASDRLARPLKRGLKPITSGLTWCQYGGECIPPKKIYLRMSWGELELRSER